MSLYIGILASQGSGGALLDSYGGAAAAFSLRKLSSTYGGAAVRVRRSLDNTEQDIQFAGGQLDQAALQAFVGYENLLTYSEQFENVAWNKVQSTVTPNAGADPLGGNNAERWLSNVGATGHNLNQSRSLTVGQSYTISIWVRSNTGVDQSFGLFGCDSIGSPTLTATTSWQRFTFSFVANTSTNHGLLRPPSLAANDLLVFGAQINQGITAQPYQVTTSTANTANGFVTKWYTQDSNWENLLINSNNFAAWTPQDVSVTANAAVSPFGLTDASKITANANVNPHVVYTFTPASMASTNIRSVYAKADGYNFICIGSGITTNQQYFDLANGTLGTRSGANIVSASIQNVGNGWYRCSVIFNVVANITICVSNANGSLYFAGDGTSGILLYGAQISNGTWLQPYQATTTTQILRRDASQATAASQPRIVNAGVIERENGKPSIRFDGIDDNLLNANTIPTTTSLSLFATFRKISHVNNAGIFSLRPSLVSPNDKDWASSNGRSFSAGVVPNGFNFIAHYIFSGSDGFSDPIDIKPNITLGSLVSTSIFETGGLASVYTNGSVLLTDTYNGTPTAPTGLVIGARYDSGVNQFGNVSIPDLILYPTNLLPSRLAIESNVGSYYQTQWIGTQQALLDQFGGSAAAFSLRNLSSSYRGPLVRVRRSNDNAETDIGGTFSGDLDVNSLLAFTGGQNLATQSENFVSGNWSKTALTATSNATIDPNGSLTANKLTETAVNSVHRADQNLTLDLSTNQCTVSFYAKAAERRYINASIVFTTGAFDAFGIVVDLVTGAIITSYTTGLSILSNTTSTNVGNGWWRISYTGTNRKSGSNLFSFFVGESASNYSYLGVVGSGVYLWGAQITSGTVLQPYVPTTSPAINGANAFVTKWYDQSGIGDNLVLQSETFGNASWQKFFTTASDNTTTAPDNTITADTLFETNGNGQHSLYQTNAYGSGVYTYSTYLKYFNRKYVLLSLTDAVANGAGVVLDLETASFIGNSSVGSGYSVLSYSITNALNGWYRYSVTVSTTGIPVPTLFLRDSNTLAWNNSYTGNASIGVYVWGAQLSVGSELLRYQPTTTAIAPKRDAIQTTAASQPRIVNAGSVESENGKPALFWTDGTGMRLVSSFSPIASPQSFFAVSKLAAVSGILAATVFDSYDPVQNVYYFTGITEPPNNRFIYAAINTISVNQELIPTQDLTSIIRDTTSYVYNNGVLAGSGTLPSGTLSGLSIGNLRGNPNPFINNYDWFGSIQELTVYPTNQPLRTSVQSNINTYYQIYWQGNGTALLDSFSGASAAYSLRNLSSAYTGPLIRVRRSNDNAERDIYGTFRGDLDLAALTSFVGANSGFVTTWYDQSGSGRHATQATAASQPRIVNAGAVDTENGKPTMVFDGSNDFFTYTPVTIADIDYSVFAVSKRSASGVAGFMIGSNTEVGSLFGQFTDNNTYIQTLGTTDRYYQYSDTLNDIRIATAITTQSSGIYCKNGVAISQSATGTFPTSATTFTSIGSYQGLGGGPLVYSNADISEVILFNTNQSASRSGVESNINNYYKIY